MTNDTTPKSLDLKEIIQKLWNNKKRFYKLWIYTFVLSCIWIFPQPRYYKANVKLAPEMNGETAEGLSSIASSFGFNIGGMTGQDAIYPELYPELFESPEFIVGLYKIQVKTIDNKINTDYYTYIRKHQKSNLLTLPFVYAKNWVSSLISGDEKASEDPSDINPFCMSRKDYLLMEAIKGNISCAIDKKTSVITISVTDQDPLICTTMADSVKEHLQNFIIRYRTSKAQEDVIHYQLMRDSAEIEYDKAMEKYGSFCDSHMNTILQSYQSERDKLESDMMLKQNALAAMETQLQNTKVKLQEKTPAFTTLQSATVPFKPAGPKRMLFVIGMLILATTVKGFLIIRKDIL